ncbi:SDR family oxidoreductase [Mycobacterium deserti]|uniref:NAD(P)H-binding protein n=1 Tax=Mycobacterium deserti TaxID=2978347 RepID=A0ABT2M578_9MYCO|nr:NAD(P)H-binding protein [Mycobacterium deserti]MCT7657402.1 NAD(P)H-binding protein [Mycobacterium deserti]
MARDVLVTGATGTLGRQVVGAATAAGHRVRALSRKEHIGYTGVHWHRADLLADEGVSAAVEGVDVIVHCATQGTGDKDVTSMNNLVAAARGAGVGHIVHVSIVGIEQIPLPYYRTKLRVEQVLAASGVGHTVLRATQFHDLVETSFAVQRFSPVLWSLRGVRFQPIDTRDVAARLVELLDNGPAGRAPDIGGPAVHTHADLARMYLAARGGRRKVVPLSLPGRIIAGYRTGANLVPDNPVGTIGFADHLAAAQR